MSFIFDRLREPSTFAGVAAFLAGVGLFGLSENEWNQIFGAVASVAGVVAMFMRDSGSSEPAQAQGSGETEKGKQPKPTEQWPFDK